MRFFSAYLLALCLLFCSTACAPAPKDPFAYADAPFSLCVQGTYLPADDPGGTPRPIAATVTAGPPINGDPSLRDLTVAFTSPPSLCGITVAATLSAAPDSTVHRTVTFTYPTDYGVVKSTAKGNEFDGLLRFAEAWLPLGDVAEVSPKAEDGGHTVTRRTEGREAVFTFIEGQAFPTRVTLTDRHGQVVLNLLP